MILLTALEANAQKPMPNEQQVITRVAFGSCAFQSVPQPIFRQIADTRPDIYLSLGDAIYADYDLKARTTFNVTPVTLQREWDVLGNSEDWQYLVNRTPMMATWDNHDYGHHSAGEKFPLKNQSKLIFLNFFGEPEDSERRNRPGIYDAKVFGPPGKRTQIVLLDTRTFKTEQILAERPEGVTGSLGKFAPNASQAATVLGADQWDWLYRQLDQPAEVRLIVSSGQVVANEKGMDEWGSYPLERRRLFDALKTVGQGKVLILSGNVHFSEISKVKEDDFELLDFTSSGLTHINENYPNAPNRWRITGPFVKNNFGQIDIEWNDHGEPSIILTALGVDGKIGFQHLME